MKKFIPVIAASLVTAAGIFMFFRGEQPADEVHQTLERMEQEIKKLEERVASLEASPQTTPGPVAPQTMATPRISTGGVISSAPPAERIVDRPPPNYPSCLFATINSGTKLSTSLTWDPGNGGTYVGDLPGRSVVEILSSNLYIWNDYPDEHALYVRVVEAPSAPGIEYQTGYIELRRINHRRCNLGAQFDK